MKKYVEIVVLTHTRENYDTYIYSSRENIRIGQTVKVPFRNRNVYGVVVAFVKKPNFQTKDIIDILDIEIPRYLITVAKWMSKYYIASINLVFKTILPKGFYKKRRAQDQEIEDTKTEDKEDKPPLTSDQELALKKIKNTKDNKPFLLFGITGSGKTEIYMRLIEEEIKKGKGSIVLVPEISLTPQTIQRFKKRFPKEITVLHSRLRETERQRNWIDIRNNKKKIVIGSRSAIFAPFNKLGLIVIDEEHEISYKQENTPKYDTITVAEKIAKETGAKLILGSATPQIESFYKAQNNTYHLIKLEKRIFSKDTPSVSIVDLRKEFKAGNKSIFSLKLQEEIKKTLDKKRQVILFLNRRGNATYVFCRDCGYVERCPNCEIPLVQHLIYDLKIHNHQNRPFVNFLQCHHCNFKKAVPLLCPNCRSHAIKFHGIGTQKVEAELKKYFPKAKVLRMDKDTTKTSNLYKEMYNNFVLKKYDILVGTQMIAKGWDIPSVDLVGIILADTAINFPDFRSEEKTFQLITQVSGRTGRNNDNDNGRVIIQTYNPSNFAILSAKEGDFIKFYNREINLRKSLNYPPFTKLVKFEYSNIDYNKAEEESKKLASILNNYFDQIVGPSPSFISKQRGKYIWQILAKFNGSFPYDVVKFIPKGWSIDIEPRTIV